MKKEATYSIGIFSIFIFSVYFLFELIRKYSFLSFEHFLEVCRQISTDLLASGLHHIGFGLSVLVAISTFIFFVIAYFSYVKTKKKLNLLLELKTDKIPIKIFALIKKNNISAKRVIIIKSKEDVAITVNWLNPKIVISTGLINKLTTKELEAVVLHEYYHLKNRHPLLLIASEVITSSLFFVPLLKDVNKKFRSALENEADNFAVNIQGDSVALELAMSKVSIQSRYSTFPSFSSRNEYLTSKKNVLLSLLVLFAGFALYIFPTQTHASFDELSSNYSSCNSQQCSVHCMSDEESRESSPKISQSKFILSSSQLSF